jgi:hypothetical protein
VTEVTQVREEPLNPSCEECGRPWFQGHAVDCSKVTA